jgi:hypothetical protein
MRSLGVNYAVRPRPRFGGKFSRSKAFSFSRRFYLALYKLRRKTFRRYTRRFTRRGLARRNRPRLSRSRSVHTRNPRSLLAGFYAARRFFSAYSKFFARQRCFQEADARFIFSGLRARSRFLTRGLYTARSALVRQSRAKRRRERLLV